MKKILCSIAFALAATFSTAQATELDQVHGAAPQGLIVRTDAQGNREVFKASAEVANQAAAEQLAPALTTTENKVQDVKAQSELDRESSNEAWFYYWNNWNWCYGYNYFGYTYYYRPVYNWYWGGYNYYYYYRF